ncbi:MAG TPA: alpha/beta hydrolase [Ramlibacter sp.]|nr:alpha/beta hydrolase [Ramlibacter sp.]
MSTWVLLRGLARESGHWGDFPAALRRELPDADAVVAVDLPGNGARWRERSPATVAAMVDAVRAALRARGCPPPYLPVALSLGGMVALQWAAEQPHELEGGVLINSSAGALSPFWQRLRPGAYPALLRWLLSASPGARESAVFAATSNRRHCEEVIAGWMRIARDRPVSGRNVARQLLAAARFRARAVPPVPLLLVAARADRLVSHRCSEAMAHAWRLPLLQHPWGGHDLPLDDPRWLARAIASWERGAGLPAGSPAGVTNPP